MEQSCSPKLTAPNIIKSLYSAPLNTRKNKLGLKLDISYITPNIIICSHPVTRYPKLLYRNNLEDLLKYLNVYHGPQNWKIYNFKAEKGSCDYTDAELLKLAYLSPSKIFREEINHHFKQNVLDYSNYQECSKRMQNLGDILFRNSWLDHSPPTFISLQTIIDNMNEFLTKSVANVAVLHCKMGKGRSGTICIAYLMKYMQSPLSESRDIFMNGRFKPGISRGVTIFSQLRYLRYHELFLYYDLEMHPIILDQMRTAKFQINSIDLLNPSGVVHLHSCIIFIKIQKYNSRCDELITLASLETDSDLGHHDLNKAITMCYMLQVYNSDIRIEFGIKTKESKLANNLTAFASHSCCWLNLYWETLKCSRTNSRTNFLMEELRREQITRNEFHFVIKWNDLDGVRGTSNKGLKLFDSVLLKWSLL